VPPRGEAHGALAESVGGQWILRFMTEAKVVPASVLRRKVEERCAAIEQQSGRKPGRKEARDLKDELLLDLLPVAFTKQGSVTVWIDVAARLLVVDAGSQGRADEVTTALVEALQGLSLTLLDTKVSAATAMAQWLTTHDAPENFSIDQECELKAADESKSVVRYARHSLDIEEVAQHIAQGKMPTRLALTWSDRVSFVLTEGLQLKKVAFLEGVFDGTSGSGKDGGFDADVAIATGELRGLLPDLLAALGGDMERAA
jgi:recombination associated protein RdgC